MIFIKKKSANDSMKIIQALTLKCMELGGSVSHTIGKLVMDRDWVSVMSYEFDYDVIDRTDAIYARQIQALVSKQDFIDVGVDREKVAYQKFLTSEENCRKTNRRFRISASCEKPGVEAIISIAQRKIADILGPIPDISELKFEFGKGITTSTRIDTSNALSKLSAKLECSQGFLPFAESFLAEFPFWKSCQVDSPKPADGKLSFVPKTALTHRSIMVEPLLNALYQKGIGSYLKKRLRRCGLDLSDQTINQRSARKGSEDDTLSTIDLSSASDHIAYGLVLELLPPIWFQLLEVGRTGVATYKGEKIELQKFSSMGNAYTFELESLIFYALALATAEFSDESTEYVRSYGDDIIIPSSCAPLLIDVLSWCGFEVNSKKSFIQGRFRESCGADYLDGFDIRPFYLKEKISERTLYLMHNWFIRHCEIELANVVKAFIRKDLALYGPDGYGDGHLLGDYELRSSRSHKRRGYCGGFFDTYSLKPKFNYKLRSEEYPGRKEGGSTIFLRPGDWVFPMYSVYARMGEDSPSEPFAIRGTRGYQKISIYTLTTRIFSRVT